MQMAVDGARAFAREKMMFKRNVGSKERVARMIFGALLICTGVVAMHASQALDAAHEHQSREHA